MTRLAQNRLAQTQGLTEFQTEILATVRAFVDKEVIPNAQELEHSDTYPQAIVDQMKDMGLFGLMIPEEYGAFSMSEPELGSDVAAIRTKAVREGDGYVINGQKMWLTNGASSTLVAALVRTEEGAT